jgi:acetyl-CoA C-acetyltransferase
VTFGRDETPRPSTLAGLAKLKPTGRADGVHTACTSSQIADGATALLLMTRERAQALGLTVMATVVEACLVGFDPVIMLEGPIPVTRKLGAIALGHPLGATGVMLVTKAVHELARAERELALVTMCCGGGLGTGTLLRRG